MHYGREERLTGCFFGRGRQEALRELGRKVGTPLAALLCGLPLAGCASGPSWKEEVVMFDGSRAVVERTVVLGNVMDQELSDVGHGPPVKGNTLRVPMSAGAWSAKWEAMGLNPQAVGIVGGTWFLSATPMLCGDYDKWGRPVPPYVFFKYADNSWQRITVDQFPSEIRSRNLTYAGSYDQRQAAATGFISANQARLLNPGLPDSVRTIYRSGTNGVELCWEDFRLRDAAREMHERAGRKP